VLAAEGLGLAGLFLALVVSRLAPAVLCSRGIPAARAEGLGHVVAGSVDRTRLLLGAVLGAALLLFLAVVSPGLHALGGSVVLRAGIAAAVGLLAGLLVAGRAVSRLGGVTGDVLGAGVETTFTATLVALTVVA
jgi:adenosylcobinamide-GDP ribazoletransferase